MRVSFLFAGWPYIALSLLAVGLAVLPLTRLAAFFVFALHSLLALMGRPISAAVHAAERWLRRHNPAPWLWPEED